MDRSSARQKSARPPTALPIPRATLVSAASRPITQQGLTGLRPIQPPNTGMNRVYHDKRYFLSRIQGHMNIIREELVRLNKIIAENKVTLSTSQNVKRSVESSAKTFGDQQELLNTYNTALDLHLSRTKHEQIVTDTAAYKAKGDAFLAELDGLFTLKVRREDKIAQMKAEIVKEDEAMQEVIAKLSDDEQMSYMAALTENQAYIDGIKKMQSEVKHSRDVMEHLQKTLSQNEAKQKRLAHLENISRGKRQIEVLMLQLKDTLPPEKQREKLLLQVKEDKADIEALMKVNTSLEEEVMNKKERLAELEHELDSKNDARLKKHRDLRERGEFMDKFIESFYDKSAGIRNNICEIQSQICRVLEHMNESAADLNFEELDNIQSDLNQSSVEGLSNQYTLLISRLNRLTSFKEKYVSELSHLSHKLANIQDELKGFKDAHGKRDELYEQRATVAEQLEALKKVCESTNLAVVEAERRKAEIDSKLSNNEMYHQLTKLEEKIELLEKENSEFADVLKSPHSKTKVDDMMVETEGLVKAKNEKLILALKNKKSHSKLH